MNFRIILLAVLLVFAVNLATVEAAELNNFEKMIKMVVETVTGFFSILWNQFSQLMSGSSSSSANNQKDLDEFNRL